MMIWTFAVVQDGPVIVVAEAEFQSEDNISTLKWGAEYFHSMSIPTRPWRFPDLLYTCRQIRAEARDAYFQGNGFIIAPHCTRVLVIDEHTRAIQWLRSLPEHDAVSIKYLRLWVTRTSPSLASIDLLSFHDQAKRDLELSIPSSRIQAAVADHFGSGPNLNIVGSLSLAQVLRTRRGP